MDMEIVFFGVAIGMIISTVLVGLGVEIADKRHNKRLHKRELSNADSDSVLLHGRCGDRCGNNRPHTSNEGIALVLKMILHTYRHNLSQHEKDCIEAAIEDYEKESKPRKPHTLEEKILVINAYRTDATDFEKCVLDEIADDLIELDAIKYVREHEEAEDPLLCPMGYCPHAE